MAPLLLHELEGATVVSSDEGGRRLRAGIVYVPCALCRTPIDAATLRSPHTPRLCERHAD